MVDPNPARGMPLQLQRYWLAGKGALKIRWNVPGDFKRCVRQLRKYFPTNPEGLCNILHTKATGGPPGHGSLEKPLHHSITAASTPESLTAAMALLDKQPKLGQYLWCGPMAPIGRPTEEPMIKRQFEPGALKHRPLPLPLDWRERQARGHEGALTVGRIMGLTIGPDHEGNECMWGWGDFLDEEIIPDARRARHVIEMQVAGASIDPGGAVVASINPKDGTQYISEYTVGGATVVRIEAFSGMRLYLMDEEGEWDDEDDMPWEDCDCIEEAEPVPSRGMAPVPLPTAGYFTVNSEGWHGLPIAVRESVFDNDDAVKRIQAWATDERGGVDTEKMRRAFLWHDSRQPETVTQSFRLPVGDIINGELTLIYHAIYAAAALLSGAHGGLPDVPDEEKNQLRNVISSIYVELADALGDPNIRAPWDAPATANAVAEGFKPKPNTQAGNFAIEEAMTMMIPKKAPSYAAEEPYGDVEYADPGYRDSKKRYPIDTPEHIRAAWSYINQQKNAAMYDAGQLKKIKARIMAAAEKAGIEIADDSMTASATLEQRYPINPPKDWFDDPQLVERTGLTITDEGYVYGHIAAWGECHRDFNECVLAPHSRMGYRPFHLGKVKTHEGETLGVGKIVMDTRHADVRLSYAAAAFHYDDTGDEIATVRAGEDEFGIWVAGAIVPEATPRQVAKLRRSPISGDWRKVEGNLELVAALAVNVPAFPVYSMEGTDRFSLVAAGMVMPPEDSYDDDVPVEKITAAFAAAMDHVTQQPSQDEALQRLADLVDDEEIYEQREYAARFAALQAAEQAPGTPPGGALEPAAGAPAAGVPATATQPDAGQVDPSQLPWDQQLMYMSATTRFSQVKDATGNNSTPAEPETPVQAPTAPVAPAPAAPAPAPVQ